MGSLSNLYISQSYQSLIHIATNNTASATLIDLQDGLGNSIGVAVNTSGDLYLSGSLTASLQQGYLYVGGASGQTYAFPTSSLVTNINTGSLVTTASFNAYTASNDSKVNQLINATSSYAISSSVAAVDAAQQSQIDNLIAATGSYITSSIPLTSLNAFTASQETKNTTLEGVTSSLQAFTQSQQNLNSTFATTGSNVFVGNQVISGNISAISASFLYVQTTYETASVIYSSGSNQFGDELTDIQTLSGSVKVQGSLTVNGTNVLTSSIPLDSLNAFTASQETKNTTLENVTASLQQFTSSQLILNGTFATTSSFNSYTQSNDQRVSSLEVNSASVNISISNINSATASLFTSASLALVTASFDNGTRNLTFTKGNTTQFSVNIPDTSGSAGTTIYEVVYTGENITKGDPLYISGSQGANPIVYKADAADPNKMPVTFISNETIGASNTTDAIILGLIEGINLTGYTAGQSIYVAEGGGWSTNLPSGSNSITQLLGVVTKAGAGGKGLVLNPGPALLPGLDTGKMWVGNGNNQPIEITTASFVSSASFNSYTSSTDSRLNNIEAATSSYVTESETGSFVTNIANNPLTPLTLIYDNAGSSTNVTLDLPANVVSSSAQITSLGFVSSSITASSLVTASVNLNTITFTKGDASTFNITVNTGSGGGGSTDISSLNAFTASQETKNTTLEGVTSSLNSATASLFNSASLALTTGSIAGNILTFTKGDNQTFSLTIPSATGSVFDTGSFLTTGSFNTSQEVKGAINFYPTGSTSGQAIRIYNTGSNPSGSMVLGITDPGSPFISLRERTWFQIQGSDDLNYVNFTASFDNGLSVGPNFGSRTQMLTSSGSLALFNPTIQRAGVMTHLSASSTANNGVNLVFADNTRTGTTIISGSDNIFTNPQTPTTNYIRYVGGSNNLYLNSSNGVGTQITASAIRVSGVRPTMNNNIFNGTGNFAINQAVNGGTHTYSSNIDNGTVTINAMAFTGSLTLSNNINANGTFTISPASASFNEITGGFSGSHTINMQGNGLFGGSMNITTHRIQPPSVTYTISNNIFTGVALTITNISSSAAVSAQNNISNGAITYSNAGAANLAVHRSAASMNTNYGPLTLIASASAINASNNICSTALPVTNRMYSGSLGSGSIGFNNNSVQGAGHTYQVSGSYNGTGQGATFVQNAVFGTGNTFFTNVEGRGNYVHFAANGIFGANLILTGSNNTVLAEQGGLHLGRYNANDGRRNTTGENIFSVGTGTSTTRKTGFLIDSGSNTFVEGTFNVSGSTAVTGAVSITETLKLSALDPLPSAVNGTMAVSGSDLYFSSGSSWFKVTLA